MKIVLFCEQRYSISILNPLQEQALLQKHEVLWFVKEKLVAEFTAQYPDYIYTSSVQEVYNFNPDSIFVPTNIVPYYLPGVKVQIFHGYAAEKSDHWKIRNYFDLYLTQGPFFTNKFSELAIKHKDFEVCETGWTRQDWIYKNLTTYDNDKKELLKKHNKEKVVLYAPTFSPSLTSIPKLKDTFSDFCNKIGDAVILIKFHPLTKPEWVENYKQIAKDNDNVVWIDDNNVTKYILMSDIMISDTSSVVYEQLLLNKPVITINSIAKDIFWLNITDVNQLEEAYRKEIIEDSSKDKRQWVVDNYDPYLDGKVSERMIQAVQNYIEKHGVPKKRKLNLWRKYTSIKKFGKIKK